jgi:hypothetical protein
MRALMSHDARFTGGRREVTHCRALTEKERPRNLTNESGKGTRPLTGSQRSFESSLEQFNDTFVAARIDARS